jgi:hypothetical protein
MMNLIYLAIALFALAAVLGLVILIKWLTSKDASRGVVYSHGLVAAVALIIVLVYAVKNPANFPRVSLVLFIISALAGFYMFYRDMNKKMSPMALAFTHALVAVAGFVALIIFALS